MDLTAEQINEHIDKFTDIYKDGKEMNPMPDDVNITVWCKSDSECGFAYNTTTDEMGLEAFIAKKWILHENLLRAVGERSSEESALPISDVSKSVCDHVYHRFVNHNLEYDECIKCGHIK